MIRASEYIEYHKDLQMGIRDDAQLKWMIQSVKEDADEIVDNSENWLNPEDGKECVCGRTMTWRIDLEDEETGEFLELGIEECFWECPQCGRILYFDDFSQNMGAKMSDQYYQLEDLLIKMETAQNIEEAAAYMEAILQFVHGRGPMADWFIQGGTDTLSRAHGTRDYSQEVKQTHSWLSAQVELMNG
jgi:hypothetical protein